jgi:hypothetical protein
MEKAEKTEAFQAIMMALEKILPAAQANPAVASLALQSIKWLITGFKEAQYIEGMLDDQLQQLAKLSQQKGSQPPQPNPEQIKAQTAQQKNQTDLQIASMENQTKQAVAADQARLDQMDMALRAQAQEIERIKVAADLRDQQKDTIHSHAMDIAAMNQGRDVDTAGINQGRDTRPTLVLG